MVAQDSIPRERGQGVTRSRRSTYFGIGAILIVAVAGLRMGVRRINDPFRNMEREVKFHLYQPAFLPYGMRLADNGIKKGAFRVVWAYTSEEHTVHVGQEPRKPEREEYLKKTFEGKSAKVNGRPATFTITRDGHWRLFWQMDDASLILTSANLSHEEMLKVAESMK